jgi:hypothetical protein
VKARVKALVFGDDNRIINPGDLMLEMVTSAPGNNNGANQTKFEVYISGRDIEELLGQVERAAYLWRQNDWLLKAATRILSEQDLADRDNPEIDRSLLPIARPVKAKKPQYVSKKEAALRLAMGEGKYGSLG